jgi:putative nucleotidyltransferase with HDIG domain/PAS domain S-box-containing protein
MGTDKEDLVRIEYKYKSILKELNDLVIECDSAYKISDVFGNIALTGYAGEDLLGSPLSLLLPLQLNPPHLKKLMIDGDAGSRRIFHAKLKRKDGTSLDVAFSFSRFQNSDNSDIFLLTIRDIGQKLQLIQQNKEMAQRIRRAEKLAYVGSLTQGLTHNLQGPLTAILGRAQLLATKYKEQRELEEIISSARNMNSVIKTLLLKISNEQRSEQQILDLNQILKSELTVLQANLQFKHNMNKRYSLSENLPIIKGIYGDFSQSFANIIKNALEAMKDSKEKILTVTTEFDTRHIVVTIADTGHGIEKGHLNKIFEPHFTTKSITLDESDDVASGMGLGLASVRELMKPYQVKFEVKSKVGGGTAFRLIIPYKKPELGNEEDLRRRAEIRLRQVIRNIDILPTIPNVLYEVLNASASEISINRLANMVQNDYALAGKIFTIVNSAYYSLMRPISSLTQAIGYLGLVEVRNICYSLLSLQIFTSGQMKPYIPELWNHSLSTAVISREIMKHIGKEIELGYLAALLHDIGKIVLLENYKQLDLNSEAPPPERLISRGEEFDRFSLTHEIVGTWFFREKTLFPKPMREAIEYHHHKPSPEEPELTRLIFFSNCLAHELEKTGKPSYEGLECGSTLWSLDSRAVQIILQKSKETISQVRENYKIEK